ncbi:hypothetical protein MKL09_23670 [Methylobacterium sp. J-048]|uniref:hypothetical protein n=1 Tax=Methylobacterium sp. J-048 TaxID=2836635 RepID=UPI001FBAA60E|nr:hypothetical protein [Methylobacterium sp. J-048]MCJ2059526.1 hypothetical protein [Methylobacterium sp. J-048]
MQAKDPSGGFIERLDVEVTQYETLTADELATIKAELDRLHPPKRDFPEPETGKSRKGVGGAYQGVFGRVVWSPPSDIDVSHYNTRHERWREGIEKSLRSYHTYLNNKEAKAHVHFELINSGSTPADDLAISFVCKSGVCLDLVREFREENNGGLTSPPKPPSGVYAPEGGMGASIFDAVRSIGNSDAFQGSGLPAIPLYKSLAGSSTRDPYGFYFHPRHDEPSAEWELRCEQFRHQLDPENFDWRVLMESDGSEMVRGVIRVRVSAANIPSPVTLNVPVQIRRRRVSTLDEAMAAIDPTVLAMKSPPRERFRNPLLGQ